MHPCPGNWVAIGHAVVYFAQADHAFSAGIKCRHCMQHSWSRWLPVYGYPRSVTYSLRIAGEYGCGGGLTWKVNYFSSF